MIVIFQIGLKIPTSDGGKTLLGSRDRASECITTPGLSGQEFLDMLGRFITNHLDLLHDHSALPLHLVSIQQGMKIHVG